MTEAFWDFSNSQVVQQYKIPYFDMNSLFAVTAILITTISRL